MGISRDEAKKAIDTIVRYLEPNEGDLREGLIDTPERVIKSWEEIFTGYSLEAEKVLESTFNAEGYDGKIVLDFLKLDASKPIIIFEYIHIDNNLFIEVVEKLVSSQYKFFSINENLICFPKDSFLSI